MELLTIPADSLDKLTPAFLFKFLLNIIAVFVLLRAIYYPKTRNKDYLFTLMLFNVVIFMITYLLNHIEISIGFAFGLFAVFTMLRYRTQTINTKDMTFLVITIGIALLHSVAPVSLLELLILNIILLTITYFLNSDLLIRNEIRKTIIYEKIDLVRPDKRAELIKDLRERTGLNIHRIRVGRIDFMRDIARIRVFYYPEKEESKETKLVK